MPIDPPTDDSSDSSITVDGAGPGGGSLGTDPLPSESVVRAISEATDTDALDLPPLHRAIDPDALDAFVESANSTASVEFDYLNLRVTVRGDGDIDVIEPDQR